ncbi:MAG TPA: pyridoxal phosphate-dependent aminotransferase [Lentisphaeria bacterium]|nr:pyridoxal phosphate-dependent aminotransferase [Lentisphaeria bacterium]
MSLIQEPVIPLVGRLVNENPGTISLGQGVVFYQPPKKVFEDIAKLDLSSSEINLYSYVGGIKILREKIREKLLTDNGIKVSEGNSSFQVSSGANMAFYNILKSIIDEGDEVIILSPYYFNYEMAIRMFNCIPVVIDSFGSEEEVYRRIETALTPKSRAIVTISPNNPTGEVLSEEFLRKVNFLCKSKMIYHISDEAYEYFVYNGKKHFSSGSIEGSEDYTISLFSMSKSYGMAGWRIGYSVMPEKLVGPFRKIQDTNAICPNVIAQYAAAYALDVGKAYCLEQIRTIEENRKYALQALKSLGNKIEFKEPDGAIYFYLKVNCDIQPIELVKRLVKEFKVAVIPGTAFGSNIGCYLRLGFGAVTGDRFKEAIDRFCKGISFTV